MSINRKHPSTSWNRRRFGVGLVVTTLALPLMATTASAAVVNPPAAGHSITVFPARDFVSADGFAAGDRPYLEVWRAGVLISSTFGLTPIDDGDPATPFAGIVEVNHPGGGCWGGSTPDIRAGDLVKVLTAAGTGGETVTAGVTVTQTATATAADTVEIKGSAVTATGAQVPIAELESRIISSGAEFANGKRSLRADSVNGFLTYDDAGITWTASFRGLSPADVATAIASESRAMWLGGTALTIHEAGPEVGSFPGGPEAPCTGGFIDSTLPFTTPRAPSANSTLEYLDGDISASISEPTTPAVNNAMFTVKRTYGGVNIPAQFHFSPTTGVATLNPSIALAGGADYTATLNGVIKDPGGNALVSKSWRFITGFRPTVTARSQAPAAMRVSRVANVSATFSEAARYVGSSTFTLRNPAGQAIACAVTYNPQTRVLTRNPLSTLLPNTWYTASLSNVIRDVDNNRLTAQSWSFKTGS